MATEPEKHNSKTYLSSWYHQAIHCLSWNNLELCSTYPGFVSVCRLTALYLTAIVQAWARLLAASPTINALMKTIDPYAIFAFCGGIYVPSFSTWEIWEVSDKMCYMGKYCLRLSPGSVFNINLSKNLRFCCYSRDAKTYTFH